MDFFKGLRPFITLHRFPGLKLLTIGMQQWLGVTAGLVITFEYQVAGC